MLKFILNNIIFKIKLFLSNKNNNEIASKKIVEGLISKISEKKKTYLEDGFKVYSQNDEDGIIESIFSDIGTNNKNFIEIGIGDGIENNTHYLLLKDWKGLWIDSNNKIVNKLKDSFNSSNRLEVACHKISSENINQILIEYKKDISKNKLQIPQDVDFFSIDIDSLDIFCIEALKEYQPRLICIEYNAKFPPPLEITIDKNYQDKWAYNDYFGSSLSFINKKMKKNGYHLISTNISGSNAFFVKKELKNLCKTKNQNIEDLYMPPNFNLFDYYVAHQPTNMFLKDKLKEDL